MHRRQFLHLSAATVATGGALSSPPAIASDDYPLRQPIRWIVPYPTGGGSDVKARTLAASLRHQLNQDILIENRPGASTSIAAEAVLRSAPDGYTIMTADNAILCSNEHLFKNLRYSPERDFTYLGALGKFPLALVISKHFPEQTYDGFVARVKAHPNRYSYGSAGNGSPHHLAMEVFKQQTGLEMQHIPHQGGAPAMVDLIAGNVDAMFMDLATGLQMMMSNRMTSLALASDQRSPLLPDLPTFRERKLPELEVFALQGLLGPAGIPQPVVQRFNSALNRCLRESMLLDRMGNFGIEPLILSPEEFHQLARSESRRWGRLIRQHQIKLV